MLYSRNVSGANELGSRKKPGNASCGSSNWSGESQVDSALLLGTVTWVHVAEDRRVGSNLLAATVTDSDRITALIWNGSSWGNEPVSPLEPTMDYVSVAEGGNDTHGGVDAVRIAFESLSGDVMVVWGSAAGNASTNGVRYATCNGGTATCTWSTAMTPPSFSTDAITIDLAPNPNSNEMVFASIGAAGKQLQIGHWSGSTWTNTSGADTTAGPVSNRYQTVAAGWAINGTTQRSLIVYRDGSENAISWFIGDGGTFTKQTDVTPTPAFTTIQYLKFETDPWNKSRMMLFVSDSSFKGYAKRAALATNGTFAWSAADANATLRTGTLNDSIDRPLAFAYWRNGAANDTQMVATVDPIFVFTTAGRNTACNGESNFVTTAGAADAVNLGNIGIGTASGAQDFEVSSNAGGGFSVYIRGALPTGNLASNVHTWTDATGSHASPAPLGSDERFGYTYHDASVPTALTNPTTATFAALTNSGTNAVMSSTSPVGTGCVGFTVQSTATTPASSYHAYITYTAIPSF